MEDEILRSRWDFGRGILYGKWGSVRGYCSRSEGCLPTLYAMCLGWRLDLSFTNRGLGDMPQRCLEWRFGWRGWL